MNVELTQSYIARKVAMRYPEFKFAKETMAKTDYHYMVMNKSAEVFELEMLQNAKATIMRRYRIKEHPMMFKNPTLRQWVTDVLGTYQQHDVLDFLSSRTGLSVKRLAGATIGDGTIDVPYLQTLVEELEQVTGKTLLDNEDVFLCPLAYLDESITYAELASYFAASGCEKINLCKIRANVE